MANSKSLSSLSLIQLAEWSCVLTHGKAESTSAFWPSRVRKAWMRFSSMEMPSHWHFLNCNFKSQVVWLKHFWSQFLVLVSPFYVTGCLGAVLAGAAHGSPLPLIKPCSEPLCKNEPNLNSLSCASIHTYSETPIWRGLQINAKAVEHRIFPILCYRSF